MTRYSIRFCGYLAADDDDGEPTPVVGDGWIQGPIGLVNAAKAQVAAIRLCNYLMHNK